MHTSSLRHISVLICLLVISAFTYAHAGTDTGTKSLGAWKEKNIAGPDILGMAFGNDTYVIVGINGSANFIATSPDGTNWTQRYSGSSSDTFNSVIFSKGRFIAVCTQPNSGNARIWISDTNGVKWSPKDSDDKGLIVQGGLHAVASDGNGKLVAVGGIKGTIKGWITVSTDNGDRWHVVRKVSDPTLNFETTLTGGSDDKLYGVGFALGAWYAFTKTTTYKSTDGSSWNSVVGSPAVDGKGYKVASNKTTVVVASSLGPQFLAKDPNTGIETWKKGKAAKGFGGLELTSLNTAASSVVYEDGTFIVANRSNGDIWTSETGKTWKRWTIPSFTTYALCSAKKSFWCGSESGRIAKSPPWFKARLGCSSDYPFTLFDAEDGPPNRIGLPQYRVNTASLNLVLEATLFYTKTLGAPINMKLIYNSRPTASTDTSIGAFGKNWRFRYESVVGRFGQDAQLINGGGRNFSFSTPNGEDLDGYTGAAELTLKAPDGIYDELKYVYNGGSPYFKLTLRSSHLTYLYETKGTTVGVNEGLFYLTKIKDQFDNTTTLTVTAGSGQISSIVNGGRTFSFAYTSGLCTGITIPGGRSVSFSHDADKNLTGITDMMGYVGSYEYDTGSTDKNGFLTKMTTAGKATTFTYEKRPGYDEADTTENKGDKYLASITRPSGFGTIKYELSDEGETVKRTSPSGEVTLISNKDGQTTSIKDPLGNVRNTVFNDAKLPSSVTDEKGGVYTYTYDDYGNILTQKDAMGKTTTYFYDTTYNIDLKSITDANGKVWSYTYNAKHQPLTVTTPETNVTTMSYNNTTGRLNDITDALTNKTSFTYDPYGNLQTSKPPARGTTTLTYDGQGFRCVAMADGNTPSNTKTIDWDKNDRITKITYTSVPGAPSYTNSYNAFGQTGFTDEIGSTSTVVRDELGLVSSVTDPLGNITKEEYDADSRPSKTIDPLGRATSTSYDSAGRPILFTDARGFKLVKEYDGVGNLVSFKDKNGAETKYAYDANSRLLTTTDPLKKVTTATRDALGRITTFKNARGQIITNTYDQDGRLTKKTSRLTATGVQTTIAENTLDKNGNITEQKDPWSTSISASASTVYMYDKNNRVTRITYPDAKVVDLTYNNGGNIATITYPDISGNRLVATYTYDKFNRQTIPSALKNNPGTELVGESRSSNAITSITISGPTTGSYALSYYDRGSIKKITRPNGIQTEYAYDAAGRITQVKHTVTAGGVNLFTADYVPDAVGNLLSESFSGSEYYSGAPGLATSTALLYNVAGELTKKGTKACVSDADGNLTDLEAGTLKCTYDPLGRLTQSVRKAGTNTFTTKNTYNADGLRVKKELVGGDTVSYHYLPSGALLFTTNAAGTIIDQHVYAGNALLATYDASGNDWLYYFCDRQGHVRFVTDDNGTIPSLAQYNYLPYGQYVAHYQDADINKFTYAGGLGVQDEGNGLFYMRNRFYDSGTGRFLQQDPIGFEGGSNIYAYADGNPLRYVDPSGTASIGEWGLWALNKAVKTIVVTGSTVGAVILATPAGPVAQVLAGGAAFGTSYAVYSGFEKAEDARQARKTGKEATDNMKKVTDIKTGIENAKGDENAQLDEYFKNEDKLKQAEASTTASLKKGIDDGLDAAH